MNVKFFSCIALAVIFLLLPSCKKEKSTDPAPQPSTYPYVYSFEGIVFNHRRAYFSTDGSMTAPVDSTIAKAMSSSIDLTFIFNFDYIEPGFLQPRTRAQHWYWDDYYAAWLSNSVDTRIYATRLTKADFDAAKTTSGKIDAFFGDTTVKYTANPIFPAGTCIGGRQSTGTIELVQGMVFGFLNVSSGKRGLVYIRTDQRRFWPTPISSTDIKVDVIREK